MTTIPSPSQVRRLDFPVWVVIVAVLLMLIAIVVMGVSS